MPFAKTYVKPLVPVAAIKAIVREAALHPSSRELLNQFYKHLPKSQLQLFHSQFATIFRDRNTDRANAGRWDIEFSGRAISIPLTRERFWLDWATALSIAGHDPEVKESYAAALSGPERPAVFIDVGANYGTHSLIFLVHGVDVLTIEPNPLCHEYFKGLCSENGVTPRLEPIAIGNGNTPLMLTFSETETWNGSVEQATANDMQSKNPGVSTIVVPQRRLDEFLPSLKPGNLLIKIDAEGFEPEVIKGAAKLIAERSPRIIFESNRVHQRDTLFDLFDKLGYNISLLPLRNDAPSGNLMTREIFVNDPHHSNFMAYCRRTN